MGSKMSRMGLRAPVNITWEMTTRCNLRCVHCLSDSGQPAHAELTFEECLGFIDEISRLKVFQVNIGGGEPFVRTDFLDIIKYAHSRGVVTCVSTNGLLLDDPLASEISRLDMLYLQVSLDGATPEVNDPIRGQGTFGKIMLCLERLARHRVPFSVNTVLTSRNYPQLDQLRALAASFGAELRVSRFRPSGRGKNSRKKLGPSRKQLEDFAEWLERHDMVRTGDSFFCLTSENRRRKGLDMCGAAKMTCCVSPSGEVYPCAFLQETAFRAGNIRELPFREIWLNSGILHAFRNLNVEACVSCSRFESCRGGCPAVAYQMFNDISKPDPECLVNLRNGTRKVA